MALVKGAIKRLLRWVNSGRYWKRALRGLLRAIPAPTIRLRATLIAESQFDEELLEGRRRGREFYFPNRSEIGHFANTFGVWDAFSLLWEYLPEPNVIVEVGANIGMNTLSFAERTEGRCQILAFEPAPKFAESLRRNTSHLPAVRVFERFLGSRAGEVTLHITNTSASIVDGPFPTTSTRTVEVTTLDEFALSSQLTDLDLLKIDTDGFDQFVLEGGRETIGRFRPFLWVEFCPYLLPKVGHSVETLASLLDLFDYSEFYVIKGKAVVAHVYDSVALAAAIPPDATCDVFAVPRSRAGRTARPSGATA